MQRAKNACSSYVNVVASCCCGNSTAPTTLLMKPQGEIYYGQWMNNSFG